MNDKKEYFEKREQLEKQISELPLIKRIAIGVDLSEFRNLSDDEFAFLITSIGCLAKEEPNAKIIEQRSRINKLIKENQVMRKILVNVDFSL